MRNLYLTFISTLIFTMASAQTETPASKAIAAKFEKLFNASQYEGIFSMLSKDYQASLTLDKLNPFLLNMKRSLGNISKVDFESYHEPFMVYKTTFEKGIFAFSFSTDKDDLISKLSFTPFGVNNPATVARNTTKLHLPFKNEWMVFWGGDTKDLNYHVESRAQKNAFDFLITNQDGKSFKTDGQTNDDYYAFGQPVIAPCNAEVVFATDGLKENKPGILNPFYPAGNSVLLKTTHNEYLFFAHFKQFSIKVKQGDLVKQGQLLGLCGNTGNSSKPHLHFHIQNSEDFNVATGIKCYFENMLADGFKKTDYSPVKGEKIKAE